MDGFWLFLSVSVVLGLAIALTPDDDPIERLLTRLLLRDRQRNDAAQGRSI